MTKILIIDPNHDNLNLTKEIINSYLPDYQVITSLTGREGLILAKLENPDVILLDNMSPNTNSPQLEGNVISHILKNNPENKYIPIIMITPRETDLETRVKAMNLGVDAFVSKPVNSEELSAQINIILRLKRREDLLRLEKEALEKVISNNTSELTESYDELILEVAHRKQIEVALRESEAKVRKRLKAVIDPKGDIGTLELSDIIDIEVLQSMMENFYQLTGMSGAIIDISGKVLIAVGWQDICTKFHRNNSETLKNCLESDTILTQDVPAGTFKAYRCKNNMWEIVTPLIVGERHVGNIFIGQYFLKDEVPDLDLFRKQARIYGFDEKEYLVALDRVPCFSKETVEAGMQFYSKLATLVSSLSFSSIKQSRLLTERKIADEALLKSETKYRELVNLAQEGIWVIDKDSNTSFVNPSMSQILGYSPEEMLGKPLFSFMDEAGIKLANENLERRKAGVKEQHDFEFICKNGTRIFAAMVTSPILDNAGKYDGAIAGVIDITERKQAEQIISSSYDRYMALFNESPVPLWEEDVTDLYAYLLGLKKDGNLDLRDYFDSNPDELMNCAGMVKFLDVNQAALDLYMANNIEHLIENMSATLTEKSLPIFKEELISIAEGKKIYEGEAEIKTLSGDLKHIHITLKIDYSHAGKVIALLATTDITERKLAEHALLVNQKRYKKAQAIGQVGNWEYNPITTNFWASDEAKRIYGFDLERTDFTTENVENCIPERDRVHQTLIDLIEHDKKYDLVFDILTVDKGIRKTIHSIAEIERDALGNPAKINGVVRNVTKQKKAEEELKESEYLYKKTQKLGKIGGWSYDVKSGLSTFTDNVFEIYGKIFSTAEEGIKFYHPDDRELVSNSFNEAITTQKPYDLEVRFKNAQGDNLFVRTIGQPLIENGKVVKIYGNLIDITERKLAEEKEKSHHSNIESLSKTAMQFVEFPQDGNIYDFVGEQIRGFVGRDSYIVVNSVDGETGFSTIQSVHGAGKFAQILASKLGRQPVGMKFEGEDHNVHYQDGRLHVYEEGLYGILLKTIPKSVCKSIEKLANVKQIYVIDLAKKEQFFGNVIIFLKKSDELKNKHLIETFIKQASIAILKNQAEEALRTNEERFRTLIENSSDVISILDDKGAVTYESPSHEKVLGYGTGELIGKNIFGLVHPDDRERISIKFGKLLKRSNESEQVNFRFLHKDGTWMYIEGTGTNLLNHSKIKGIVVNYRDVTERKKAEAELLNAEEKYRIITQASLDIIFILDKMGKLLFSSGSITHILGYQQNEYIGRSFTQFVPKKEIPKYLNKLADVFKHKEIRDFETQVYHKDGHLVDVEINGKIIRQEGKLVAQGTIRDITDRKLAEEMLHQRMAELEIFNEAAVDRELMINDQRKEINELLIKLGKGAKYEVVE